MGQIFAQSGIRLIYGGGSVGLMGSLARSVMEHGGRVTGIIPRFLSEREVMLRNVDELIVTRDMHERKRLMFERSDAFVALPGGIGTLEELVEMMTWAQLGQHEKPVLIANVQNFWEPLVTLLDHMIAQSFIRSETAINYILAHTIEDVVPQLEQAVRALPQKDLDQGVDAPPLANM